ncbi:MAG: tetratricopeptide repeat protein [Bryobacteraceae bacterium]
MRLSRLLPVLILAAPVVLFGQRKEVVELQRDVATLQDQVRTMQRSFDEKMAALSVLVQQTLDNVNKTNTAVAVLESGFRDRMREQEKNLIGPVTGVGSKVEQMTEEFRFVRESIADLNSRMSKLQAQVTDLKNIITTLQAPPGPPTAGGFPTGSVPPPGLSAEALYSDARRDYEGGKYDLAMQEFTEFLRFFGTTDLAPNAQFYVGMIHYNRAEMEDAILNFDMVLEKFPENNKTLDAMLMKGNALVKLGRRAEAAQEFREVIRRAPSTEQGTKARAEMKKLGLSTSAPARKK